MKFKIWEISETEEDACDVEADYPEAAVKEVAEFLRTHDLELETWHTGGGNVAKGKEYTASIFDKGDLYMGCGCSPVEAWVDVTRGYNDKRPKLRTVATEGDVKFIWQGEGPTRKDKSMSEGVRVIKVPDARGIYESDGGWFFLDETGSSALGPFPSDAEAADALNTYAKGLNRKEDG